MRQDWLSGHQFECEGVETRLGQDEEQEIESSTKLLKPGRFLSDDDLKNNPKLSLDMLEFVDEKGKILGKGAYGQVRLVKLIPSDKLFALKIIPKNNLRNDGFDLMREVEIHKRLKHQNIVRLINHFEDK